MGQHQADNIHIIGFPERKERENEPEKLFQDTGAKTFPNLGKKTNI